MSDSETNYDLYDNFMDDSDSVEFMYKLEHFEYLHKQVLEKKYGISLDGAIIRDFRESVESTNNDIKRYMKKSASETLGKSLKDLDRS